MFTGIIEGRGTVHAIHPQGEAVRLVIVPPEHLIGSGDALGDSIAINGCCLTIVETAGGRWAFQAGTETLSKTNLGGLRSGDAVNLERAMPADGRFGGHIVQGHVDGVGEVTHIERDGEWITMRFRVPQSFARQMVPKGSVAVDGVSLTLVDVKTERFSVALIPHTLEVTTLGLRSVGDRVNIETDILARYVEKLLSVKS